MKRLLLIFFSLLLFASVEGQIIRANPFAKAQVSGTSYGTELNPDVPCENTAYWYEFGSCLAQAGGMTLEDVAGDDYVVSNPNSGWASSGDFHIVVTVDNYAGAGAGLRVTFGNDFTVDYITADGRYAYDVTSSADAGIYIDVTGCSCRITSLSIKAVL